MQWTTISKSVWLVRSASTFAMGKLTGVIFVIWSILLLTHGHEDTSRAIITRHNYGVIIRPIQNIRLLTDEWTHEFVTQLPDTANFTLTQSTITELIVRDTATTHAWHPVRAFNRFSNSSGCYTPRPVKGYARWSVICKISYRIATLTDGHAVFLI